MMYLNMLQVKFLVVGTLYPHYIHIFGFLLKLPVEALSKHYRTWVYHKFYQMVYIYHHLIEDYV